MEFPHAPVANTNLSAWLKKLLEASKGLQPAAGGSVDFQKTADGLILNVADSAYAKKNNVTYWGEYVQGSPYAANAMVFRESASAFTDGSTNYSGSSGFWLCVSPVPPKMTGFTFSDGFLTQYYAQHGQLSGVCYDPIDNPPSNTLGAEVTGSQGRYWRRLSAPVSYVTMSFCLGGEQIEIYVNGYYKGTAPPS